MAGGGTGFTPGRAAFAAAVLPDPKRNRRPHLPPEMRGFIAVLALLSLTACGGGGGSGLTSKSTPSTTVPHVDPVPTSLATHAAPFVADSEYTVPWGLAQIGAATAYARIAERDGATPGDAKPGEGARVAVIDTGVDTGHWEFNGLTISNTCSTTAGRCGDRRHGTAVASVIAATRDQTFPSAIPARDLPTFRSLDFHGVAWGIDSLESLSIPLGVADPNRNYRGTRVEDVDDAVDNLTSLFSELTTSPDFVNMSFSYPGLIENYRGKTFGPLYGPAVRTMARTSSATGKAIFVIAAGNHHGSKCARPEPNCVNERLDATSPALLAGLPVITPSLRSQVVSVVATNEQGNVAPFSNRCGIAAKWCIAAPGQAVRVARFREGTQPNTVFRGYTTSSGTSLSAPFVTGGLAVMKHWFRSQMRNEELLVRLYETARVTPDSVPSGHVCPAHLDLDGDRSDCELSSIFGRGMMDLAAATAPVGMMSFGLDGERPLGSSRILTSRAIGDGMRTSLAGREVALFDELGAPFWIDAGHFVQRDAPRGQATRVSRLLAGLADASRFSDDRGRALAQRPGPVGGGLRFGFDGMAAGHLGLVPRAAVADLRLGSTVLSAVGSTFASHGAGVRRLDGNAHGIALSWRTGNRSVGLTAGWVEEKAALLGATAHGAFGGFSSRLGFAGVSGTFDMGGWRFDAHAELGHATPHATGMLFGGEEVFSTAFSAAATRRVGDGILRFTVEQPLRVENGSLGVLLPVGRTPDRAVQHQRVDLELEPSGRQIDFGAGWTEAITPDSVGHIGAVLSHQAGHISRRDAVVSVLAGLRIDL